MQSLKVSLLTVQSGLRIFHSEFCETEEPKTINRGLRGWAEMRFRTLRDRLRDSQGKAARLTRKVVAWLHRWTHPDEALLSRLRSVELIDIEHPASMTDSDAREAWNAFLAEGLRRHRPWFVVNLLISPLTVVLAPLPGPNIIGYWFVFRAWQDGMILLGIRRVIVGPVEITFRPNPDLEPIRADPRKAGADSLGGAARVA